MKVAVLVKYVPEPTEPWTFGPDNTLDREAVEGRLSELDEYAVEQAVRLRESGAADEVVHVTLGPPEASVALRKALAIGGDAAVHVVDDAVHGSDALGTSLVLAEALRRVGADLVLTGMASTDAEMSVAAVHARRPARRRPGHLRRRGQRRRGDGLDPPRHRRGQRSG